MAATLFVLLLGFAAASHATALCVASLAQDGAGAVAYAFRDTPPQEKPAPKPIKVTGAVKDDKGSPVSKAHVKITGPDEFEHETWTDEGVFEFTAPDDSGPYQITIKLGDKEGTFDARIRDGRLTPRQFTLRPAEVTR